MEAVEVLDQRPMERVWTEAEFFSDTPDWLKEAMRCDAISPVTDGRQSILRNGRMTACAWEVGHVRDGRLIAYPGDEIARSPDGRIGVTSIEYPA